MNISTRARADFSLLLVSLIWGSAFVVQRIAAGELGGFLFNGLRFSLGAVVLAPLLLPLLRQGRLTLAFRANWRGLALAGSLLFGGAALQQFGLIFTTAGNAGFITGLYVVLIPLIQTLILQKPPRPVIWLASALAFVGLFLLSAGGHLRLSIGDALELAGAFFWACHVLLIGVLAQRLDLKLLSVGQYLVCAALNLTAGLLLERASLPALETTWPAVVYTGLFSVGLGYTLQTSAQRTAPPADAAVLLSLEAPFAALFGWLFLSEALRPVQLLGCGLILAGTLVAQMKGTQG